MTLQEALERYQAAEDQAAEALGALWDACVEHDELEVQGAEH